MRYAEFSTGRTTRAQHDRDPDWHSVSLSLVNPCPIATTANQTSTNSVVMLCQLMGGAIFIAVAQNIFSNELVRNLGSVANIDASTVIHAGATELKSVVGDQDLAGVLVAYNDALISTFYVSVAMGALSIVGSAMIRWKSVKGQPVAAAAA